MELNTQPRERQADSDSTGFVYIHSIWHTIQGEGPFAGCPAIFVRVAGCNLQCPLCDTDYTSQRKGMLPSEIIRAVREASPIPTLVVLSGGEPFRQDIAPLCSAIIDHGLAVQIETNGSLYLPHMPYGNPLLTIVCSPKTTKVHPRLAPHIRSWKYVLAAGEVAADGLPMSCLGGKFPPARPTADNWEYDQIYVQPLDEQDGEKNKEHMVEAVRSCMQHGYRLCLQMHKIVGLK
jgi:7-carboxy-7-deazaguanine synthase